MELSQRGSQWLRQWCADHSILRPIFRTGRNNYFMPIPRADGGSVQHGRWKLVDSQARNPLTVLVLFLAETLSNMLRRAATTP